MIEKPAILHFMLNPRTGPWSVMKSLAEAQLQSKNYAGVALGILTDSEWPAAYESELKSLDYPVYRHRMPSMPGTAQHLWMMMRKPPLVRWLKQLASECKTSTLVVHFHNAWTSGAFLPVKVSGLKFASVATFHGIASAETLSRQPVRLRLHRMFAQRLIRHNATLTSVDRGCLGNAEKLFGLPADRFAIVPNGVPVGGSESCPFAHGADCLTIGHIGALTEEKGWRMAAEAIIDLSRHGKKFRMFIAGMGPQEQEAHDLASQFPDCLTYLGHVTDPTRTLLPHLDLFVLMTSNDGLPMAIIEAMSYGVPVIATAIGGIPDTIEHEQSGYIIPRSKDALIDVLEALYNDPQRILDLSSQVSRVFADHFDIARIVETYDGVYEGALNPTPASTGLSHNHSR